MMNRLYSVICCCSIFIALMFVSCNNDIVDDAYDPGEGFTESNVRIVVVDTFDIRMSTFRYDSIINEGQNRVLVGRYSDPYFGVIKATAFADFTPETYSLDEEATFDSIAVSLKYDGFYYNDTLLQKTIKIQELTKEIRYKNNESYFYNTSDIESSNTIIGQKTFYPRISNDSIAIRLTDAFGQNLFDKIQSNIINDQEQFTDYFKGLKIAPDDTEDASIIAFNIAETYIRIYYSLPDQSSSESEFMDLNFRTNSNKKFFSKIESDRNGTPLENVNGKENEATSASLNDLTYIQSGIGITTKVTFPNIRDVRYINNNNGSIFKANLKIKLNSAYYDKKVYPSDSLYVYVLDQNNDILAPLYNSGGDIVAGYIDYSDEEINEVYLYVPVEAFLEKVITNSTYLNYGLTFIPLHFNSATERLILNGENNSDYESRLELTYIIYDK
ncbi:DUF4270 family protein [Flavobacterium arcticum]|uniref:DUF4270 family protein n=1 Tax=Flavobacterium arcticum TaxID=1784713 RepID=A0A345H9P9_9FLAO|nr:DUF4270 family protein [Flavobacterium arcticum]AXG73309.1 DUF4270 family protein [Flavobacterium arcticum]KAF2513104.1 DUF4270 domain-containing protein [Flavobacterium arcticum]